MAIADFRTLPFARPQVEICGRFLGHNAYWKLYAIENCLRVVLHSVLTAQIGDSWFRVAVDKRKQEDIELLKRRYLSKKVHTIPGSHDIYYLYLSDLNKIMVTTRHLVQKFIPDVDNWIVKLEEVRTPRNLVGHMNFPNESDRRRIDDLHKEMTLLVGKLEQKPGLNLRIP